jgi:hypothetical protein
VYEANGPLKSMDDILIHTERGVRDVTTEEWGKLKGHLSYWGTTAKDMRWIIREPSLNFWYVLGESFAPTLTHPEEPNLRQNGE